MKIKMISLVAAVALSACLFAVAATTTGAYLSDTKSGQINGTMGSIKVTTTGGGGNDGLVFDWVNMLPGVVYSAEANIQNTGNTSQDVWLEFPNLTALSAFNSLGRFGAVKIWSGGTLVFESNNLNDHPHDTLAHVPESIQLASNLGPTSSVKLKFEFQYAPKMDTPEPGGVFNQYPRLLGAGDSPLDLAYINGVQYGQVTVVEGVTGSGLPYDVVATEPGILPGTVFATGTGYAGF